MNVTPYERTRWDKGRIEAMDRLNRARRTVDATHSLCEVEPDCPFAADLHDAAIHRLRWALAVEREWAL